MRISTNMSALKANSNLKKTETGLDKALERLSSGFKINRSADDAAGMAISQKMKTQIRGLERASQNAADGVSVIQTAEGALQEIESMLQRIRELAVQSANGTNQDKTDREAIQKEVNELKNEIQRISDQTEFNTKKLLNGEMERKVYSDQQGVNVFGVSDTVEPGDYKVNISALGTKAQITGNQPGSAQAGGTVTAAQAGKININGSEINIEEGDTRSMIFEKLRNLGSRVNVDLSEGTPAAGGFMGVLTFQSAEAGSDQTIDLRCDNPALGTLLGINPSTQKSGTDAQVTIKSGSANGSKFSSTATASVDGNRVVITDKNNFELKFDISSARGDTVLSVLDAGQMPIHIGANAYQTMDMTIPKINPMTLGLDNINLGSQKGAGNAITMADDAISNVLGVCAKLGAYQNRLEHAIANLDTSSENLTEALSRITDTNMATEMANYTQKTVLSQAGTSMLAQANQRPQNILTLLQG